MRWLIYLSLFITFLFSAACTPEEPSLHPTATAAATATATVIPQLTKTARPTFTDILAPTELSNPINPGNPIVVGTPSAQTTIISVSTLTLPPEPTPTRTQTATPIVPAVEPISFWYQVSPEEEGTWDALIAEFNGTNPYSITIEATLVKQDIAFSQEVEVALSAEKAPTLIRLNPEDVAPLQLGNLSSLTDLSSFVTSDTWGWNDEEQHDLTIEWDHFAPDAPLAQRATWPFLYSVELLYYNLDILQLLGEERPPTSWDAFEELACAARDSHHTGYQLLPASRPITAMLMSRGGQLATEAGTYVLDQPAAIESLELVQRLATSGCATLLNATNQRWEQFATGTILFTIDASEHLPRYQQTINEGYGGQWAVMPLPNSSSSSTAAAAPRLAILNSTPNQELAAWLFLKWLMEATPQARLAQASHHLPVRQSATTQLSDWLTAYPHQETALTLLPTLQSAPPTSHWPILEGLIAEVVVEISLGANVSQTLPDLNEEINLMLESFE